MRTIYKYYYQLRVQTQLCTVSVNSNKKKDNSKQRMYTEQREKENVLVRFEFGVLFSEKNMCKHSNGRLFTIRMTN